MGQIYDVSASTGGLRPISVYGYELALKTGAGSGR